MRCVDEIRQRLDRLHKLGVFGRDHSSDDLHRADLDYLVEVRIEPGGFNVDGNECIGLQHGASASRRPAARMLIMRSASASVVSGDM